MVTDVSAEDVGRLAGELAARFGLGEGPARAVAQWIEERLAEQRRRFNAMILLRVMMRLGEADTKKVVAVSMAFAAGVRQVCVRRTWLRCTSERDINAAARALRVRPDTLRGEIARSRRFLGLEDSGLLAGAGGAEAFRRATANQSWRN